MASNLASLANVCPISFWECPFSKSLKLRQLGRAPVLNFACGMMRAAKRRCEFYDLHQELVPYVEAWSWQKKIVKAKKILMEKGEDCSDTLIILQHQPVYTLGTGSLEEYLNFDIKNTLFDVCRTERGGEVTYHAPGQLVMYPIINLRYHRTDLQWCLRALEEVVIRVLNSMFAIKASCIAGLTGVWVGKILIPLILCSCLSTLPNYTDLVQDFLVLSVLNAFSVVYYIIKRPRFSGDQKLAAVGIKASQWIAYHGLALNVTTDLTGFRQIVPCGIKDRRVGSMKGILLQELASSTKSGDLYHMSDRQLIDLTCKSLVQEFCEVFQMDLHQKPIPLDSLKHSLIEIHHN